MHRLRAFNDRSGSDEVAVKTGEEEKKGGRERPPDDLVSTPLRERAGDFLPGVRAAGGSGAGGEHPCRPPQLEISRDISIGDKIGCIESSAIHSCQHLQATSHSRPSNAEVLMSAEELSTQLLMQSASRSSSVVPGWYPGYIKIKCKSSRSKRPSSTP